MAGFLCFFYFMLLDNNSQQWGEAIGPLSRKPHKTLCSALNGLDVRHCLCLTPFPGAPVLRHVASASLPRGLAATCARVWDNELRAQMMDSLPRAARPRASLMSSGLLSCGLPARGQQSRGGLPALGDGDQADRGVWAPE